MSANSRIYSLDATVPTTLASLNLPTIIGTPLATSLGRGDRITVTQNAQQLGTAPNQWTGYGATIEYPAALGGSSFIYGSTRTGVATQITGAQHLVRMIQRERVGIPRERRIIISDILASS
jgi:hypothetical protein